MEKKNQYTFYHTVLTAVKNPTQKSDFVQKIHAAEKVITHLKKYVVVLSVRDTEDIKQKHVVDIHASDGMFKHLINMVTHHLRNLILLWNKISAEIQMVFQQFGAIQQIQLKDGNFVTQCNSLSAMKQKN